MISGILNLNHKSFREQLIADTCVKYKFKWKLLSMILMFDINYFFKNIFTR